jgi:hypothetical protein
MCSGWPSKQSSGLRIVPIIVTLRGEDAVHDRSRLIKVLRKPLVVLIVVLALKRTCDYLFR